MLTRPPRLPVIAALSLAIACATGAAAAQVSSAKAPPFGGTSDVDFAQTLWKTLAAHGLAGADAIQARPYKGRSKVHGAVLETMKTALAVAGRSGETIVKRNYGPKKVSLRQVWNNPQHHLKSVTVMFRREKGYAPDSGDWFWVKYNPDGTLATAPNGMKLAGQVTSCISCHRTAKTGFVFSITGK